jgi:rod shape-determining protein MreC
MRDRTSRALKQFASIFLLVATLSMSLFPPGAVEFPRLLLTDAVAIPAAPLHFITSRLAGVFDFGFSSGPSRKDLENEIKRLTADLVVKEADLQRSRQELESYKEFMAVPRANPFFVWNGDLLGYIQGGDTDVFSRSYIISVGSHDGVAKDLPVVWGNVALGKVSQTYILYSRVRVLADPLSRVCVRFANCRYEGVLVGSGRQICPVRYVPNRVTDDEIKVGDAVVTSGTDGIFPPDLVVGKVTRFARRPAEAEADVEVELWMDFSRLENCLVLKKMEGVRGG